MGDLLTFRQHDIGTTISTAPGDDGFDSVKIEGISDAEAAALNNMKRGYTISTASLILPYWRKGMTAYATHRALANHLSYSTVRRYFEALPRLKNNPKK